LRSDVTAGPPKKKLKLLCDSDEHSVLGCSDDDDDDRLAEVDKYFNSAFDCEELTPL